MIDNFDSVKSYLIQNLQTLPQSELSYYIALLLASIENESTPEMHMPLLTQANLLIEKLNLFYKAHTKDNLSSVTDALTDLITESNIRTISKAIKKIIMQIVGFILALSIGILLSAIGLIGGLIGGLLSSNFIEGAFLGFIVGFFKGLIIGTRLPNKLFQSEFDNKLDFIIRNIDRVVEQLPNKKMHADYEEETKQYIIANFFGDQPTAFDDFIKSKDQEFEICTKTAGHFSKSLKGYLGHHAFIRFSINGNSHIPIEFGNRNVVEPAKMNSRVDQSEKRIVTGQKLFDMLVMDRILQETHQATFSNYIKFYEVGSEDCLTYVDKVLIATGQPPTEIRRFNAKNDKFVATSIIAPLFRFFNTTREDELDCVRDYFKDRNSHADRIDSFVYQSPVNTQHFN